MLIGSSVKIAGDIDMVEVVHGSITVNVNNDSVPATAMSKTELDIVTV